MAHKELTKAQEKIVDPHLNNIQIMELPDAKLYFMINGINGLQDKWKIMTKFETTEKHMEILKFKNIITKI